MFIIRVVYVRKLYRVQLVYVCEGARTFMCLYYLYISISLPHARTKHTHQTYTSSFPSSGAGRTTHTLVNPHTRTAADAPPHQMHMHRHTQNQSAQVRSAEPTRHVLEGLISRIRVVVKCQRPWPIAAPRRCKAPGRDQK